MRELWFDGDGTRLFAVEDGAGPPVIMAHGGLVNHLAGIRLIAPLASRFRIVAPDLRASGKSWDAGPLTWDRLADDVAALLDHLGVHRAVVGGVSSGSGVALRFALRYPDRVAGLLLVTPLYGGAERGLTTHQVQTFKMMDDVGRRAIVAGVEVLRPLYASLPPAVRERVFTMIDGFDAGSVAATTAFLASGLQPFDAASELRGLGAATLLIPGKDPLHPEEVSDLYAANIPSCHTLRGVVDVPATIGQFCDQHAAW